MKKKEKGLSALQLTMMALGTVIGGSFFLGSSVAIHAAGPAVLISFTLGGIMVYYILHALSEMTVANPGAGSFRAFAAQAFGQGTGFVVGWVYWTGMVLAMSSEATAVSILIREWFPQASIAVLGSLIIVGVTLLNLLGAHMLSRLESGLAAVKLLAIVSFILIALLFIAGLFPGSPAAGAGELVREPFMPGGIKSIAGSMLIVMFSYAGFEIIGLAASEAKDPEKTIPKAIRYTVVSLIGFYILTVAVLLPLIPTADVGENMSPLVAALDRRGLGWAGTAINVVLITAILSTMLAAMFGLGRIMRSLAADGLAPRWLRDKSDVPYRGILISGVAMLAGLGVGLLLPQVYLFLVSSGGFAILFTYVVIMATHIQFCRANRAHSGAAEATKHFPYSSLLVLIALILTLVSMPYVSGQKFGLIAGVIMAVLYTLAYQVTKRFRAPAHKEEPRKAGAAKKYREQYLTEFSKGLNEKSKDDDPLE